MHDLLLRFQANDGTSTQFTKLYSFNAKYGHDTRPQSLHNLLEEMSEFGSDKFNAYYDAVYVDTFNDDYMPCSAECKASHLCAIAHVNYDDFDVCYDSNVTGAAPMTSSLFAIAWSLLLIAYTMLQKM